MNRHFISTRLIVYQIIAFGILLLLILSDELWEFPHFFFGPSREKIKWDEVIIETLYIVGLAAATAYSTWRLITRIKFLEGFMSICSHCKKIKVEGEWKPVEDVISSRSSATFTHGLCPECMKEHYSAYLDQPK